MITANFFRAMGDDTRLEIVRRLSSGKDFNMNTLSDGLKISRQGVRKHIEILANAKIISLDTKGRDTHVQLNRKVLEQGKLFIMELERKWDNRLEALKTFVEKDR